MSCVGSLKATKAASCCLALVQVCPSDAGLAEEAGECEELRAHLSDVQSHCASLPAQNQQLQHTLERETRELQLQESGVNTQTAGL